MDVEKPVPVAKYSHVRSLYNINVYLDKIKYLIKQNYLKLKSKFVSAHPTFKSGLIWYSEPSTTHRSSADQAFFVRSTLRYTFYRHIFFYTIQNGRI